MQSTRSWRATVRSRSPLEPVFKLRRYPKALVLRSRQFCCCNAFTDACSEVTEGISLSRLTQHRLVSLSPSRVGKLKTYFL